MVSKPSLPATFDNILLPISKKSLLKASKAISTKHKKNRQKKYNKLQFIKGVPQHPQDRLMRKIKKY